MTNADFRFIFVLGNCSVKSEGSPEPGVAKREG